MKRNMIRRLISLALTALLLTVSVFAEGSTSKWAVEAPEVDATSEGIIKELTTGYDTVTGHEMNVIVYTIPKGFSGKLTLNPVDDLIAALQEKTYMPGDDDTPFTVRIINKSGLTYEYVPGSFKMFTENLQSAIDNGYTTELPGAVGFDNSPLVPEYVSDRTANNAIAALYNVRNTKVTAKMVGDEMLGQTLIDAGYENGIQDLGNYYLDFFNEKYSLNATKLEDFPDNVIAELFGSNTKRITETCTDVAVLSYNWWYNRLFSIIPVSVADTYNDQSTNYTIGAYMRGETTYYETSCVDRLGTIADAEEGYELEPFLMYLNFYYITNAYQGYNFGFYFSMSFTQATGSVTMTKVDSEGATITLPASFTVYKYNDEVNKAYLTEEGAFSTVESDAKVFTTAEGLIKLDGLTEGIYYFHETNAPEGYVNGTTDSEFVISANANTTLSIANLKDEVLDDETDPAVTEPAVTDTDETPVVSDKVLGDEDNPSTGDFSLVLIAFVVLTATGATTVLSVKKRNH